MENKHWHVALAEPDDFAGWANAARGLLGDAAEPAQITWGLAGQGCDLFGGQKAVWVQDERKPKGEFSADLAALLRHVLLHRDGERFALAYRLAWRRLTIPHLLQISSDADVFRAQSMAKSVRRDMHKMTAFVRFRKVETGDDQEAFVSWFEPDHFIVRATAPFFMRRFAGMRWSILTPDASAHWNLEELSFGPGSDRTLAPGSDALEDVWRTYYASIFNPARLKIKAMQAEMAKKYWKNLPEAPLIAPLIRDARSRTKQMIETAPAPPRHFVKRDMGQRLPQQDARPHVNPGPAAALETHEALAAIKPAAMDTFETLRKGIEACRRCPLHGPATQAVPGEGPANAALMIVGEQPGDQEDLAGQPFAGPAGKLLDVALKRAGIAREEVFVTNAVKHFKFEPRGKRRLHKRPDASEIDHCKWWIDKEIELVQPQLIIALGATAARSLLGHPVKINEVRGEIRTFGDNQSLLITVHPSYLLRLEDEEEKRSAWHLFVQDLTAAQTWLAELGKSNVVQSAARSRANG